MPAKSLGRLVYFMKGRNCLYYFVIQYELLTECIQILLSFQKMSKLRHNEDTMSVCLSDLFTFETIEQI